MIGIGRTDPGGDEGYRAAMRKKLRGVLAHAGHRRRVGRLRRAAATGSPGTFDDAATYDELQRRLDEVEASHGTGGNVLFYLSVPPSQFPVIVDGLGDAGLATERAARFRRIVIEKPFGARPGELRRRWTTRCTGPSEERQVFRIDHYLGKETVQNILVFRFANGIFEPVWNRNFIDHVQITVAESIGVEGRGRFYEEAGALRDIVQNHMLQVLLVRGDGAAGVVRRRGGARRARQGARVVPAAAADRRRARPVRGRLRRRQARARLPRGGRASRPTPTIETYVAARLHIDNWRWADTPFYLRTGKRLPKRVTEVAIQFKRVPHLPFSYAAAEQLEPNVLVLRIQPERGHLAALRRQGAVARGCRSAPSTWTSSTTRRSRRRRPRRTRRCCSTPCAATRTNFPRQDAVERVVADRASRCSTRGRTRAAAPHLYPAGTWGPEAADDLLARDRPALAAAVTRRRRARSSASSRELRDEAAGEQAGVRTNIVDLVVYADDADARRRDRHVDRRASRTTARAAR